MKLTFHTYKFTKALSIFSHPLPSRKPKSTVSAQENKGLKILAISELRAVPMFLLINLEDCLEKITKLPNFLETETRPLACTK